MSHPSPQSPPPRLLGRLLLATELGAFLGDTRIRLLEAVGRYGSIARAAKAVPMSYKSAWDALDAMNNLAGSPLVESSIGGRHGGGTRLTDWGRRLVALFRVLERHYQGTLDLLAEGLEAAETSDPAELRALLRRMTLRTSARNRLVGTLVELRIDEPRALATLALAAGPRVAVALTADSARELGLAVGGEVYALIKASSVVLGTDPSPRISAANRLWGEVSRIHEGTGDAEVTLILAGGWT